MRFICLFVVLLDVRVNDNDDDENHEHQGSVGESHYVSRVRVLRSLFGVLLSFARGIWGAGVA